MTKPIAGGHKCGAKTRGGGQCAKPAGWGTDHAGFGKCKLHGGSHRNGRKAAQREQAEHAVATYGLPREIEPHAALEEELWRTAGHVAYLATMIAAFESDQDLKQYAAGGSAVDAAGDDHALLWEKPAVWVELYHRERKHLVEVAKTCVACGIEERRIKVIETLGQQIAEFGRGLARRLGHDPDAPAVREAFRAELTVIEGGRTA